MKQFVNWFFESCIIGFGSFYLCSYVKLISVWGKNFKWLKLGTFDEAIKYYLNLSTYYYKHTHNNNKKGKKEREKKEETLRSNYAKVHFVNQETNCTTHYPKGPKKKWNRLDDKTFHVISSTQSCNKVLPNPCNKCKHSQILRG